MPWTGGPGDQHSDKKEGERERRKSQNFMRLCGIFEGGVEERNNGDQSRLSDNLDYRSKDTHNSMNMSNFTRGEDTQQNSKTFASLRAVWEPVPITQARNPVLKQRKLSLTNGELLLVKTVTNKRKGGDHSNGSTGKRTRPG